MEIIKYEKSCNNKYKVYLSNEEILVLDERVITNNNLLFKKNIDNKLYRKLIDEDNIYKLFDMAIKYINIRLRSIKEVEIYLNTKGASKEITNNICKKLISLGYLDDSVFAKAYVNDKLHFTNLGDYKIKLKLQELGVSSEIIESVMENLDFEYLNQKINKEIEKLIRNNKKESGFLLKNKIYKSLLNKGYSSNVINNNLNNYNF